MFAFSLPFYFKSRSRSPRLLCEVSIIVPIVRTQFINLWMHGVTIVFNVINKTAVVSLNKSELLNKSNSVAVWGYQPWLLQQHINFQSDQLERVPKKIKPIAFVLLWLCDPQPRSKSLKAINIEKNRDQWGLQVYQVLNNLAENFAHVQC